MICEIASPSRDLGDMQSVLHVAHPDAAIGGRSDGLRSRLRCHGRGRHDDDDQHRQHIEAGYHQSRYLSEGHAAPRSEASIAYLLDQLKVNNVESPSSLSIQPD